MTLHWRAKSPNHSPSPDWYWEVGFREGTLTDIPSVVAESRLSDHHRRLHAGDSRKREGDGSGHQQRTETEAASGGSFLNFRPGASRGAAKLLKDWWTWSGSNRRPLPCHGSALPAAPQAHIWKECNSILTHAFALVKPCERHLLAAFFPSFGGIRATVRNTGMAASCAATENPTSAGTETS